VTLATGSVVSAEEVKPDSDIVTVVLQIVPMEFEMNNTEKKKFRDKTKEIIKSKWRISSKRVEGSSSYTVEFVDRQNVVQYSDTSTKKVHALVTSVIKDVKIKGEITKQGNRVTFNLFIKERPLSLKGNAEDVRNWLRSRDWWSEETSRLLQDSHTVENLRKKPLSKLCKEFGDVLGKRLKRGLDMASSGSSSSGSSGSGSGSSSKMETKSAPKAAPQTDGLSRPTAGRFWSRVVKDS